MSQLQVLGMLLRGRLERRQSSKAKRPGQQMIAHHLPHRHYLHRPMLQQFTDSIYQADWQKSQNPIGERVMGIDMRNRITWLPFDVSTLRGRLLVETLMHACSKPHHIGVL